MTTDDCLNELRKVDGDWYVMLQRDDAAKILQHFGMELVEASVGVKQKCTHQDPHFCEDVKCPKIQWNRCREQTLEAARKMLGMEKT